MRLYRSMVLVGMITGALSASAQKYVSERGNVSFFSDAALEDIKALNQKAISIFNTTTNDIAFSITIKDFHFDNHSWKNILTKSI